jgi:hypothetical protein
MSKAGAPSSGRSATETIPSRAEKPLVIPLKNSEEPSIVSQIIDATKDTTISKK